jgi:hypothetical protein
MRQTELQSPFTGTTTHPYVANILLDPAEVARFIRMADDQNDVRLLGIDQRTPDRWTVFVACASRDGRDMLESEW